MLLLKIPALCASTLVIMIVYRGMHLFYSTSMTSLAPDRPCVPPLFSLWAQEKEAENQLEVMLKIYLNIQSEPSVWKIDCENIDHRF